MLVHRDVGLRVRCQAKRGRLGLAATLSFPRLHIRNLGRHGVQINGRHHFLPIFVQFQVAADVWAQQDALVRLDVGWAVLFLADGERLCAEEVVHGARVAVADGVFVVVSVLLFLHAELHL